jgi:hypothetical protein
MIDIYEFDDVPKQWERQKGESERAYGYFIKYRDMGARHSLRALSQQEGIGLKALWEHSAKWKWRERLAAWMDELDRVRRDVTVKEVQEMTKRHAQQSMMMQRVIITPAEIILKKIKNNPSAIQEFENMSLSTLFDKTLDAARVFSAVVDVERKSRGEPSEILKQDLTSNGKEIRVILPPGITKENETSETPEDLLK